MISVSKNIFYSLVGILFFVWGCVLCRGQSTHAGYGAFPYADETGTGVSFRVWAPEATSVNVAGDFNGWSSTWNSLVSEGSNGVWSLDVEGAYAGQEYKFWINDRFWRRDPRSREVVHSADANSVIYDSSAYTWKSAPFTPPALSELIIYELHVGSFYDPDPSDTKPGNFYDAIEKLDYLQALGINAVEVMPVAEFPGDHSWGYNPIDLFAVEKEAYGGPDAFKAFVDACHQRKLAVLLDTVHNHYGNAETPSDLEYSLWEFDGMTSNKGGGIYFFQDDERYATPFGRRPDYSSDQVRQFIKDNICYWLDDFRVDGFRWDATKYIRQIDGTGEDIDEGISLLKEINDMMASNYPGRISIAEDLSGTDYVTAPTPWGLGFDSDWHTDFHNEITDELAKRDADMDRSMLRLFLSNSISCWSLFITNITKPLCGITKAFATSIGLDKVAVIVRHNQVGEK